MTIPIQQQVNLVNLIPPGKLYYEYKVYEILSQLNPGASDYDGFMPLDYDPSHLIKRGGYINDGAFVKDKLEKEGFELEEVNGKWKVKNYKEYILPDSFFLERKDEITRELDIEKGIVVPISKAVIDGKEVPCILIQGEWLDQKGFHAGDEVFAKDMGGNILICKKR